VNYGDSYSFTLNITNGYEGTPVVKANGVTLTDSIGDSTGTYTISNITADQTITVDGVTIKMYTVTVSVTDPDRGSIQYRIDGVGTENGFITLTGGTISVPHGSTIEIRAVPDAEYAFVWDDGTGVNTTKTITNVTESTSVGGTFIPIHTITVIGNEGGSFEYRMTDGILKSDGFIPVGADGNILVSHNSTVEIRAVPNAGYEFEWNDDIDGVIGDIIDGILTITNVTVSVTAEGSFTYTQTGGGSNTTIIAAMAVIGIMIVGGLMMFLLRRD
jgi:hypothetical protein